MRRALIATAGTAAAVAALLSYKSSNAVKVSGAKISLGTPGIAAGSSDPTTTRPAASAPETATPATTPATTTPSTTTPSTSTTTPGGNQTLTGADIQYPYGDLQLRVTKSGGKITNITIATDNAPDFRSQRINSQALAILIPEAIAAQGTNIDAVSGATFTSEAFAQALQSAIDPSGA